MTQFTITRAGRALRDKILSDIPDAMDFYESSGLCSLLCRHARTYERIQELWCSYEMTDRETRYYEKREASLEKRMRWAAERLRIGIKFTGDPRGCCVKLLLPSRRYNSWGGEEDGWGIDVQNLSK